MSSTDRSHRLIGDEQLLRDFVDESRELLETVSQGLLRMEDDAEDRDIVHRVFRALHSIKGCSSFLGLQAINQLSHAGENVLEAIREGTVMPARDVIDSLLTTCDVLSSLIDDVLNPAGHPEHDERYCELTARLAGILEGKDLSLPAADGPKPVEHAAPLWPLPGMGLPAELVRQFVAENGENLQEIEAGLLRLEKRPDDIATINAVFRPIHSVKGTADYVGLAQIKTLSHHLESVLDLARANRLALAPRVTNAVFEGVDALKSMIQDLRPDGEVDRDLSHLVGELLRITGEASAAAPPASPSLTAADSQLGVFARSAMQHVDSIRVQSGKLAVGDLSETTVATLRRSVRTLLNAADYMERLEFLPPCERLLELIDRLPSAADAIEEPLRAEFAQLAAALLGRIGQVRDELRLDSVPEAVSRAPVGIEGSAESAANSPGSLAGKAAAPKSMRVEQEKLDEYINLAGELMIARNTLYHAFHEIQGMHGVRLRRLRTAIEGIDRIAATLQDNAMSMRMVPVKSLFQRFPRVIRDIAKAQGKKIDLQIVGEETEIDKQVAEALGDPLVHLVRNSADHGIEPPAVRLSAGKPEAGTITLKACREGNSVVIEIIDDGAGIPVARLKAKAVQSGVITQQQADAMQRDEAIQLIFAAGLSTASQVTDISGRGVGMDVVRTNIKNCGGSVFVTSQEGAGTQLRIELPLTLAVTTALLVVSEGQTYALPIETVQETIKVAPRHVRSLNGNPAITLRGNLVPLKRLSDMLAARTRTGEERKRREEREPLEIDETGQIPIVVVDTGGQRFGLVVNAVQGRQDIVLKPLPEYLARLPGLGSATIMGDGTIVLIVDPADMEEPATAQHAAHCASPVVRREYEPVP